MKNLFRQVTNYALCLMLLLGVVSVATAQSKSVRKINDATEQSRKAAKVFTEIMAVPDKAIPHDLLDKAEAVAVFPNVIKAGFIVGGRGGRGVISRRVRNGWSAPAFFDLGGASIGLQIGASSTDFVLLFMNQDALKGLLEDKFEIGGEGSENQEGGQRRTSHREPFAPPRARGYSEVFPATPRCRRCRIEDRN